MLSNHKLESLGSFNDTCTTSPEIGAFSSPPPQSHLDCCGFDNDTRYFTQESPDECMEGHPRCNTTEELLVVRAYLIRK